ncbi:hypothetical protein B5M43_011970 [Microbacterium sp. MEC084]|uniref:GPW/gp25 family protein n=1 Tax=Microbacterium sp. MEC084 TaxID=1963027 RepID=UPI00106FA45B|nr:GPW/gp25 family protein [Microbacterium sp. MEC084]MCD1269541.1 hypothetical protein [Microbacterium sp. MEC084]
MSTRAPVRRTPPVTTGWRFAHPDSGRGPGGLTIADTGRVELVRGADAVRQSLILLLSTVPGERVMRPDYGCELARLVFWPNDDTTAGLAIHYVRRAVERFEPRVVVLGLDAGPAPDAPDRLEVVLDYRPRLGGPADRLVASIPLQGAE